MGPEQRGETATVGVGQRVLNHEGVDVDQRGLQHPQAQHVLGRIHPDLAGHELHRLVGQLAPAAGEPARP